MGGHAAAPARARVVTAPPAEGTWTAATDLAQPVLTGGAGAKFVQWDATRDAHDAMLVTSCVATPIPGWVEDMRPTVEGRTVAMMNAAAERVVGVPVDSHAEDGHFSLRIAGSAERAAPAGVARTFVGWNDDQVVTCFTLCARPNRSAAAGNERACDASALSAHLDGTTAAPPPGLLLGSLTWAVHHPTTTVTWAGAVVFVLGVVAVASRRRPRSRI